MNVMFVKRPNPMTAAFLSAMDSLGFKRNDDFNGPDPEGYGPRQGTIRNGRRVSTATAYLQPASRRRNLTLITDTRVARVILENRRATGVELLVPGGTKRLTARREVIVSRWRHPVAATADALRHRRWRDTCKSHGIEVKHHLPGVGANSHDHLAVALLMEMRNTESYGISWRTVPRGALNLLEYALFRSGPLSSNVFETNAFVRTTEASSGPTSRWCSRPRAGTRTPFRSRWAMVSRSARWACIRRAAGASRLRAQIRRAAGDRSQSARRSGGRAPLLRGLQLARRIVATAPFARYEATEVQPGPSVQTEEGLIDYIRRAASTVHHPVQLLPHGAG